MHDQISGYRSPPLAADDFAFIAERMKHLEVPADYDLGGPAPAPGYRGPLVEDVADIGRRLRALEAPKKRPPPHIPAQSPASAEDWWCC